jgi:hypothetical protein
MAKNGMKKAIGLLLILFSVICIVSGGYVWYMNTQWTDRNGFTTSQKIKISTDSPIIVFSDHIINMKDEIPPILQILLDPDNFTAMRWTIQNNLGKDVFIGIAPADKARDYCKLTHYKEADDWDTTSSPWSIVIYVNTYLNNPGADSIKPPGNTNMWLASGFGREAAGFEKVMVSGEYWVMIMNVDGSPGLNVDLEVGGKMPLILGLPPILIGISVVLGTIGIILYIRARRPK